MKQLDRLDTDLETIESLKAAAKHDLESLGHDLESLRHDLESLKHQPDSNKFEVFYRICDSQVKFGGKAWFLLKDDFKKSGATWSAHERMWVMPHHCASRFMLENANRVAFRASDD